MQPEDYSDILEGIRAGRLTAESARRLMEQRQRDIQAAERDIRAHSHAQALQQAHDALDRGHQASYTEDDFKKLFNPNSKDGPLGDPEDDDPDSLTGPHGHYQPKVNRPVEDQQKRASASAPYSDREIFESLYPPGTRFDPDED